MTENLTVAIVAHNEEHSLPRCLASLARQTGIGFSILLIDNGSTDSTYEVMAEFALCRSRTRVIRRAVNHLGEARAQAVTSATTELIAFLDADCEARFNWVSELLNRWREVQMSHVAVGGPHTFAADPSRFGWARAKLHQLWLGHLGAEQINHPVEILDRDHLPTANVLYRRESVLSIGNFSGGFPRAGEDLNLSQRLKSAGLKLGWAPSAQVVHFQKTGWRLWLKRIFRYGRVQTAARGRKFWFWPNRLRLSVVAIGLALIAGAFKPEWIAFTFGVYLLLVVGESIRILRGIQGVLPLAGLLVVTHSSYALGLFAGLLDPRTCCQTAPASRAEK